MDYHDTKTRDQSLPLWIAFGLMFTAIVLAGTNSLIPAVVAFLAAVVAFVVWRRQGAPSPFPSDPSAS